MNEWRPISTAPKGKHILYFPETYRERFGQRKCDLPPMVQVGHYPTGYPRQPSHWMPVPPAPDAPTP